MLETASITNMKMLVSIIVPPIHWDIDFASSRINGKQCDSGVYSELTLVNK